MGVKFINWYLFDVPWQIFHACFKRGTEAGFFFNRRISNAQIKQNRPKYTGVDVDVPFSTIHACELIYTELPNILLASVLLQGSPGDCISKSNYKLTF